jgi:hypothetical protein
MPCCHPPGSLHRIVLLSLGVGLAALSLTVPALLNPPAAFAQSSAAQPDPAWDFGRGGVEMPGQPACYLPARNVTERRMYSLTRPSCFPGKLE